MAASAILWIRRFDLFSLKTGEAIYREASLGAAAIVPPGAIIVSMQMSGALKYYADRPVARWDALRPDRFGGLRAAARARGLGLYALLWPFEEADFAGRLPGAWKRIGVWRDITLWRLD
jgi:hypothetical protein